MGINWTFVLVILYLAIPGCFMQPASNPFINPEDVNIQGLSLLKQTNPTGLHHRNTRDADSTEQQDSKISSGNNQTCDDSVDKSGFVMSLISKVWHGWQLIFRQVFHGVPIEAPDEVSGRQCVVVNGEVFNEVGLEKTVRSITNKFKNNFKHVSKKISDMLDNKEKRDVNENQISNQDV